MQNHYLCVRQVLLFCPHDVIFEYIFIIVGSIYEKSKSLLPPVHINADNSVN